MLEGENALDRALFYRTLIDKREWNNRTIEHDIGSFNGDQALIFRC